MARRTRGSQPPTPVVAASRPSPPPPAEPRTSEPSYTVSSGMALQRAVVERVESTPSGVTPEGLEPATEEQAPLLSAHPMVLGEATDSGLSEAATAYDGSPPPVEGRRIRSEIGQRHGVDLSSVPLNRSADGDSEASRMRARAFTSDQGIVIPARVGSVETGSGEALLAHELTHVAQRARYGSTLPSESTPVGRLLEAEALVAERTLYPGPSVSSPLPTSGRSGPPSTVGPRTDGAPADAAQPCLWPRRPRAPLIRSPWPPPFSSGCQP